MSSLLRSKKKSKVFEWVEKKKKIKRPLSYSRTILSTVDVEHKNGDPATPPTSIAMWKILLFSPSSSTYVPWIQWALWYQNIPFQVPAPHCPCAGAFYSEPLALRNTTFGTYALTWACVLRTLLRTFVRSGRESHLCPEITHPGLFRVCYWCFRLDEWRAGRRDGETVGHIFAWKTPHRNKHQVGQMGGTGANAVLQQQVSKRHQQVISIMQLKCKESNKMNRTVE